LNLFNEFLLKLVLHTFGAGGAVTLTLGTIMFDGILGFTVGTG